ncbi:MAG TPA: phosphoenolpyruvate--protein phosphotransferase, partial [Longimicrobiales bacterium]
AAYTEQADRLFALGNVLFAARAADIRDVGKRVLHLLIEHHEPPPEVPPGCIIVAEDLSPSETATLDRERVRGICTSMGSATSHAAILARALGIPAIAGIDPRALDLLDGTHVILDGDKGVLNTQPTSAEEAAYARQQAVAARRHADQLAHAHERAITKDGERVEVAGNVGDEAEVHELVELGGEGIGLLRTEFLFMERRSAPDEEEQTRAYRAIARVLGPERILVMRTLDVGGDKPLTYMPVGAEANPFLGERGIRLSLHRPDVLRIQIRAMLRAAGSGNVAIMFPMIATLAEWREARAMVDAECQQLGIPRPQLGIMVETASAALLADHFAAEADFFSIGTNDLTQYTLAMDRTHPRLAPQLDALHPAVLRLIEHTVNGARKHDRWVGVCGALASDPQAVPILIGLGVHELSVSVPAIPAIKARVRTLTMRECRETARAALALADAEAVRALATQRHGEA